MLPLKPRLLSASLKQSSKLMMIYPKGTKSLASIEKDKATGINVVKVLDKNTRKIVSQFPSKEIIAIAEAIDQHQEGKGHLIHVSA